MLNLCWMFALKQPPPHLPRLTKLMCTLTQNNLLWFWLHFFFAGESQASLPLSVECGTCVLFACVLACIPNASMCLWLENADYVFWNEIDLRGKSKFLELNWPRYVLYTCIFSVRFTLITYTISFIIMVFLCRRLFVIIFPHLTSALHGILGVSSMDFSILSSTYVFVYVDNQKIFRHR